MLCPLLDYLTSKTGTTGLSTSMFFSSRTRESRGSRLISESPCSLMSSSPILLEYNLYTVPGRTLPVLPEKVFSKYSRKRKREREKRRGIEKKRIRNKKKKKREEREKNVMIPVTFLVIILKNAIYKKIWVPVNKRK